MRGETSSRILVIPSSSASSRSRGSASDSTGASKTESDRSYESMMVARSRCSLLSKKR